MLKTGMIIAERYEILGKIGTGGMADVYKAKDHKLNRFVAVKVLKPEFREDTTFIRKFRSEAQAAAGLTHPNIVNVFDVGDDEGVYYIVMELIEGITLKEYIAKKGKLSIKEATSIAIQVSMGLEAAHNHGIVHRDVKPQNIIISTDGKVKVTDFGIARAASSNTISSNVMGSVHYSSPEQVRGGYSDEKSDIYSLGITLYEMVTGRVPFDGDTTVAIAIKHLQEEMVPPSVYAEDLPYSLEQIILKCTQKSVNRRYDKMEDVIADKIAEYPEMRELNREWSAQFEKYAHAWMPKLFPANYYKEMINYWIPFAADPNHRYPSIRFPWITTVAYTSEVADETAQGEYLNLCARAHVAHDEATIRMLMEAVHVMECHLEEQDGQILTSYIRQRPMIVKVTGKNK